MCTEVLQPQPLASSAATLRPQAHLERRQRPCDCCCCGVEVHLDRLHCRHEAAAEQEQQQGRQSAHAGVYSRPPQVSIDLPAGKCDTATAAEPPGLHSVPVDTCTLPQAGCGHAVATHIVFDRGAVNAARATTIEMMKTLLGVYKSYIDTPASSGLGPSTTLTNT